MGATNKHICVCVFVVIPRDYKVECCIFPSTLLTLWQGGGGAARCWIPAIRAL